MKRLLMFLLVLSMILQFGITCSAEELLELENVECLEVYVLNVGEGDATVVVSDNHAMIIDGGPSSESDKIYSFLKSKGISRLDYVIATHPDADHVGGLSGALNYATVGIAFCTIEEHTTNQFSDFKKYLDKQNCSITVPNKGDVFTLGDARVEILAPDKNVSMSDNTSIVVKISFGDTSFLFTGDSEDEDEKVLLTLNSDIRADVLKVAHHGSSSSTSDAFLKKVNPKYAVISVGDNSYGHPAGDVLYRLDNAGCTVLRTDECGMITFVSDGSTISIETEKGFKSDRNTPLSLLPDDKNNDSKVQNDEPQTEKNLTDYIVNTNTGKFHYPSCNSVSKMKEKNKMLYTGTRDDLIARGYSPCGNCHP